MKKIIHLFFFFGLFTFVSCATKSLPPKGEQVDRSWPKAYYSWLVWDEQQEKYWREWHSDVLFTPASCLKVVTAFLTLNVLGPEYKFETRAYELSGKRLVLSGGGDPLLKSSDLEILLKAYQGKAFRKIILDFSRIIVPPHSNNIMTGDVSTRSGRPVMALNVDENLLPEGGSPRSGFEYVQEQVQKILNKLKISGDVVQAFTEVHGEKTNESFHLSSPIKDKLPLMMSRSDNLYFDLLYLMTAQELQKKPLRDWHEGGDVIKKFISQKLNLQGWENVLITDGSGLSRYNRLSAHHLLDILRLGQKIALFKESLIEKPEGRVENYHRIKSGRMFGINCHCGYTGKLDAEKVFIFHAQNFSVPSKEISRLAEQFISEAANF
jgi:D-alanyl-D-alanine carboxypeptidase